MNIPDYLVVFAIAAAVGGIDIALRNRISSMQAVLSVPAGIYLFASGVAAAAALWVVKGLGWTFHLGNAEADQDMQAVLRAIAGIFGWAVIMKGAVITWGDDHQAIARGPYELLERLLSACDQEISDHQNGLNMKKAKKIMAGVSFDKAWQTLPLFCLTSKQLPAPQAVALAEAVNEIGNQPMSGSARSMLLGVQLIDRVGDVVLKYAVDTLGEEIR